jgi:hypothetical protein
LVLAVILGPIMVFAGSQELWLALTNRAPIEMSLADFLHAPPQGRWVRLTGCRVGYGGMVYRETLRGGVSTLSDVSVPVLTGGNVKEPVGVVLCVADKRERAVVARYRTMGMPTETIEGVIRGGPFYNGMSPQLQKLAPWKLADRYVIIDEGRRPSIQTALIMLGVGTALMVWIGALARKRFGSAQVGADRSHLSEPA